MFAVIRFAIIFTIFAFGDSKEKENRKKYVVVPIRVRREPPDTVEFQFNKSVQIEPISLKANEVNFQLAEENDDVKKFRNTRPLNENASHTIKISLEYREPERTERKVQSFLHAFRESLDEVITVRVEISLPQSRPQIENPMETVGIDAIVTRNQQPTTEPINEIQKIKYSTLDDGFDSSCENDDGYADKLLFTALQHSTLGTHLLLKGLKDTQVNPVDAARDIIAGQLELPHLEYKILQAKFDIDGLLFEMQSLRDVIEILSKKDSVDLDGIVIEPTEKTIFDLTLDVRSDT